MLDEFIKLSQRGDALWISDVRKAFAAEPDAYRAVIRLECLDGTLRDYTCPLPAGKTRPNGTLSPNISPPAFSTFSRASAAARCTFILTSPPRSREGWRRGCLAAFTATLGLKKILNIARRLCGSMGLPPFGMDVAI